VVTAPAQEVLLEDCQRTVGANPLKDGVKTTSGDSSTGHVAQEKFGGMITCRGLQGVSPNRTIPASVSHPSFGLQVNFFRKFMALQWPLRALHVDLAVVPAEMAFVGL
jgi:hypothetical protein